MSAAVDQAKGSCFLTVSNPYLSRLQGGLMYLCWFLVTLLPGISIDIYSSQQPSEVVAAFPLKNELKNSKRWLAQDQKAGRGQIWAHFHGLSVKCSPNT